MEHSDNTAQLNTIFDNLEAYLKQLSVAPDADHRVAGRCKRALNHVNERLCSVKRLLDEKQAAAQMVLDRIRNELAELDPVGTDKPAKAKPVMVASPSSVRSTSPDNLSMAAVVKNSAGGEWLSRVGGRVVSVDRAAIKSMEEFPIAPKFSYPFRVISKREDCLKYPGQLCWLSSRNLPLVAVAGVIITAAIPRRFSPDMKDRITKVLAHRDPESVDCPNEDNFYIDPLRNPRSSDTGNLMADTQIRPASLEVPGGRYAVRVGGYDTIVDDLALCSLDQLEYAFRFFSSGLMTAILIAETIQKRKTGKQ